MSTEDLSLQSLHMHGVLCKGKGETAGLTGRHLYSHMQVDGWSLQAGMHLYREAMPHARWASGAE